jgi:hypothetical protein
VFAFRVHYVTLGAQALAGPEEPQSPFVHDGFKIVMSDKPTVTSMVRGIRGAREGFGGVIRD